MQRVLAVGSLGSDDVLIFGRTQLLISLGVAILLANPSSPSAAGFAPIAVRPPSIFSEMSRARRPPGKALKWGYIGSGSEQAAGHGSQAQFSGWPDPVVKRLAHPPRTRHRCVAGP